MLPLHISFRILFKSLNTRKQLEAEDINRSINGLNLMSSCFIKLMSTVLLVLGNNIEDIIELCRGKSLPTIDLSNIENIFRSISFSPRDWTS